MFTPCKRAPYLNHYTRNVRSETPPKTGRVAQL